MWGKFPGGDDMLPRIFSMTCTVGLLFLLFIFGCSGSSDNPAVPGIDDFSPADLTSPGDMDRSADSGMHSILLLGYYDAYFDPDTMTIETVPLRTAEFTLNLTNFLQAPAGNPNDYGYSNFDFSQIGTGRLDCDISVTFPFPTAIGLFAFDTMVVIMGDGSMSGFQDSSLIYPSTAANDLHLVNPDGYTRWMNPSEFTQPGLFGFTPGAKGFQNYYPTSTLNGYKWYSDSLGPTTDIDKFFATPANVAERGSWSPGSTMIRRFELQFPMVGGNPDFHFQYAVLINWAPVLPFSMPPYTINDYPFLANLQEPFHVDVSATGSTLYYVNSSDLGGNLKLRLEIYDWQGLVNLAGIPAELSNIWVEDAAGSVIPGGYIDVLPTATVSAGGLNSSVFNVDISGCTPTGVGRQEFLVTAESAFPTDYSNGFPNPYPIGAPLSAFAIEQVQVGNTNPCPVPTVTSLGQPIVNVNDVVNGLAINGTNFQSGPQLAATLKRVTGDLAGTNLTYISSISATADFNFTSISAGMYDLEFINGCGKFAPLYTNALEVNTPPASSGITGPTSGDATAGVVSYNANASDSDTDPVDILSYTWTVTNPVGGAIVIGPAVGDPFSFNYATLPVGNWNVNCTVSDGYPPADLTLQLPITRNNTAPTVALPTGQVKVWQNDILTYSTVATDLDPGQTLTYTWSFVQIGNAPSYTIPGDPIPGDVTIDFSVLAPVIPGIYDLSCQVDDGSGAPNAVVTSGIFQILVYTLPYTDPVPVSQLDQVLAPGMPSTQGWVGCPQYWDGFYNILIPANPTQFPQHPDIAVIGGPSIGATDMVIADELLLWTPVNPLGIDMGFAHFPTPFVTGNIPAWVWTTSLMFPVGTGMAPSCLHFDGSTLAEFFITNTQMTNNLLAFGVPDPAAIEHYDAFLAPGLNKLNDLYTSNGMAVVSGVPDVAVDVTAGFDMGSMANPATPNLYGLYTQDASNILFNCGGPASGPIAPNPVHILMFPSKGVQMLGTPVDGAGPGVVAPMMAGMAGPGVPSGPGIFGYGPGGVSIGGALTYPEPYYSLAIDDDPQDNPPVLVWPNPIFYVLAASIDSDRDLEIFQIDFGVPSPGPAPIMPYASITMPNFMGGNPNAYPIDCEFISNFSSFGGTSKPIWPSDLLAVLLVDPIMGAFMVEIFDIQALVPTSIALSMPVPVPPMNYQPGCLNGGVAFRLDVDEMNGDIYVLHESVSAGGGMGVTIFSY